MSEYILLYFLKNALKPDGDPLLKGWCLYLKGLYSNILKDRIQGYVIEMW